MWTRQGKGSHPRGQNTQGGKEQPHHPFSGHSHLGRIGGAIDVVLHGAQKANALHGGALGVLVRANSHGRRDETLHQEQSAEKHEDSGLVELHSASQLQPRLDKWMCRVYVK